jgi:hypothetical protein
MRGISHGGHPTGLVAGRSDAIGLPSAGSVDSACLQSGSLLTSETLVESRIETGNSVMGSRARPPGDSTRRPFPAYRWIRGSQGRVLRIGKSTEFWCGRFISWAAPQHETFLDPTGAGDAAFRWSAHDPVARAPPAPAGRPYGRGAARPREGRPAAVPGSPPPGRLCVPLIDTDGAVGYSGRVLVGRHP